ncbi:MAG: kynureninase [Alphaproteobacteria bacterium]|nr:kynureninase [Alphaproteobacteria bacterium]
MSAFSRDDLLQRDREDPLAFTRDWFQIPDGVVYLDGNSLGALSQHVRARLEEVITAQWGQSLVRAWNAHDWIDLPARVGAKIAPLIGARANEVTVGDSTSVNLFKLASGALALRPGRSVILTEAGNFPTDLYVLQGVAEASGGRVRVQALPRHDLLGALNDEVALLVLTHAHYKSAALWPMAEATRAAHAVGALTLWDLSHSAGAVTVDLNAAQADLAVGCGYKYLNGGPGAPSYVFVAARHQERLGQPIWGWMGHAAPFDFTDAYAPAPDVRRQLAGTPPILSLSALDAALDLFADLDMSAVAAKGQDLVDLFISLVEARCAGLDLHLMTPRDRALRGSHVSFAHPQGHAVMQALIANGVIGDFRAPDIVRFGLTPLYLRHVDVWDAVETLRHVLTGRLFEAPRFQARQAVT